MLTSVREHSDRTKAGEMNELTIAEFKNTKGNLIAFSVGSLSAQL
jgi:hypothetical protein